MAAFVAAQRDIHQVPHAVACRALGVSQGWFYKWRHGDASPRHARREQLKVAIRRLFAKHRGTYGSPRVTADLRDQGWVVSENTVARLMRELGLAARPRRRRKQTTRAGRGRWRAPDLIGRDFGTDRLNHKWYGDGTEIVTDQGRLFLDSVLDMGSRRIVGFGLGEHHDADLSTAALRMAVATRGGAVAGVIFHSDRGSQYTSAEFRQLCDAYGVQQSMGRTGVCWDNALAESFFATYKLELIEQQSWPTRARARSATVHWLEAVYNRQRRHSAIDMLSPVDYEERYWDRRAAA